MLSDWHLHYFRWVIGDGEPERDVGEVFEWFAVSFWSSTPMVRADERAKSAILTADYLYRVNGEVAFVRESMFTQDSAYQWWVRVICCPLAVLAITRQAKWDLSCRFALSCSQRRLLAVLRALGA